MLINILLDILRGNLILIGLKRFWRSFLEEGSNLVKLEISGKIYLEDMRP
mgnify:CR=1 FL=1